MASKPEPPLIGAVKKAVGGRHKQPGRLAFVSWATIRRIYDIVHIMVLRGVAAVLAATVSLTLRNWAIVRVNGDISAFSDYGRLRGHAFPVGIRCRLRGVACSRRVPCERGRSVWQLPHEASTRSSSHSQHASRGRQTLRYPAWHRLF